MKIKRVVVTSVLAVVVLVLLSGCGDLNSSPVANFTRTPSSGGAPLGVSFNAATSRDSDGTIVSYEWNFGDGYSGSGEMPTHTFNSAGTYSVRLTVTDNGGARNSTSHSITVTAAPPQVEYRVTAEQLLDEYDANEVAADMKYKGKLIAVTGYVDSISTNSFTDEPYVELAPSQAWTLITVNCYFRISQQAQLAQLNKGELITIVGVCHGKMIFSVMLEECHIE